MAQALLRAFKGGKGGIAAPSANKFGHVSPTTAQHVRDEFGPEHAIASILDGGQSAVGIESTILDLSRLATHGPVLLRPGHISAIDIAAVIGRMPGQPDAAAPRASGTLAAHYAPRTPVALVAPLELDATLAQLQQAGRRIALMRQSSSDVNGIVTGVTNVTARFDMPAAPDAYAHGLYVALRQLDSAAADLIVVEVPPQGPLWQGVNDRLHRAAHDSTGVLARLLC